jgi:hypothetical protein
LRSRRHMTGVRKTRYEIFSGQPEKSCFAVNTSPALLARTPFTSQQVMDK